MGLADIIEGLIKDWEKMAAEVGAGACKKDRRA